MSASLMVDIFVRMDRMAAALYPDFSKAFDQIALKNNFENREYFWNYLINIYWPLFIESYENNIEISLKNIIEVASTQELKSVNKKTDEKCVLYIKAFIDILIFYSVDELRKSNDEMLARYIQESLDKIHEINIDTEFLFNEPIFSEKAIEYLQKNANTFYVNDTPNNGEEYVDHYYWGKDLDMLLKLYIELLDNNLIEEKPNFIEMFQEKHVKEHLKTVWKGEQTQLVMLTYYLFEKEFYKAEPLHIIIARMFLKQDRSAYNTKSLATTYLQIKPVIDGEKKISKRLLIIKQIAEKVIKKS